MVFKEKIMLKDKYLGIFSWQIEATVFIVLQIFFTLHAILKIGEYINSSLHLKEKYARRFVRGHYLFQEATCELRGTNNVQGQISYHIFAPNGGYCLNYECCAT